ncbi:ankyrin repeat [Fusarium longipes]|uniref:Ankyrin repeat n=1 Tax=Fusarium longipes TaxID=694270 RepID=A0A395RMN8_9HYPO|nr:ankyrin repeat [Fusarium longipes]
MCQSPRHPTANQKVGRLYCKGRATRHRAFEAGLKAAISGFSAVFTVIDALDECPAFGGERSRLLDFLERTIAAMPGNLCIFCTSRVEPDIDLAIDELLCPPAKAAINLTKDVILSCLQWLAFSRGPLHLGEIAEIFIFHPETTNKIDKERLFQSELVLKYFHGLVTTERISGRWERRPGIYVLVAHITVKEYLVFERIRHSSLLIKHGADVHVQVGHFGSAWQAAAAAPQWSDQGGNETLRLLLDNGVDVNDCRSQWRSALQVALEHTDDDIEDRLHFLSENGADVNIGGGLRAFLLHSACLISLNIRFHETDRGLIYLHKNCANIDVNMTGGIFGTALQAAAYMGKGTAVKLLLKKGANVDIRAGRYRSVPNTAVMEGRWHVGEILLDSGATPDFHQFLEPDEEWLEVVGKENGRSAVERYRKVWE